MRFPKRILCLWKNNNNWRNNNNNSFGGSYNNYGGGNNTNNKGSGITYSTNSSQKSLMKSIHCLKKNE